MSEYILRVEDNGRPVVEDIVVHRGGVAYGRYSRKPVSSTERLVSHEEYSTLHDSYWCCDWKEIEKEEYLFAFEQMFPVNWRKIPHGEIWQMPEALSGIVRSTYAEYAGKYFYCRVNGRPCSETINKLKQLA